MFVIVGIKKSNNPLMSNVQAEVEQKLSTILADMKQEIKKIKTYCRRIVY